MMLKWTGERYIPTINPAVTGLEIHYEHLHRYAFASHFVRDNDVLDLGSGEGYGSYMLAQVARKVIGVDIDPDAIEYAKTKYQKENLEFLEGSICNVPLKGEKIFDVIVCFEALEHIEEQERLLSEIKRLLKDDGLAILSTPNKSQYTDESGNKNPFHKKELYFEEFKQLFEEFFPNIVFFGQKISTGSHIWSLCPKKKVNAIDFKIKKGLHSFDFTYEDHIPLYYIAVVSKNYLYDNLSIRSFCVDISDSIISLKNEKIDSLQEINLKNQEQIIQLTHDLAIVKQSIMWRLLMKYHKEFIEKVLPPSTRTRNLYDLALKGFRSFFDEGTLKTLRKFTELFFMTDKDRLKSYKIISNTLIPHSELINIGNLPRIAIIIVTYNSASTIKRALDSALKLHYPLNLIEIIVVDNSSTDDIEQVINHFKQETGGKFDTQFIKNISNFGFGKGSNIGACHASVDVQFLFFLNPDCQLYEDTLDYLIPLAVSSINQGFRLWECRQLPYEHPKYYNPVTLETTWSSAACVLIERTAFENIGGFDEKIFLYLEDVDLSWRLRMGGNRLMYVPKSRVYHNSYNEPNMIKPTMYYNSLLNGYYLRYKFGSFWEIMKYNVIFWHLIYSRPNSLDSERKNLFLQYIKHFKLIPFAISFRIKNRNLLHSFRPSFFKFEFEMHRPGAFVRYSTDTYNAGVLPKVSIVIRTIGRKGLLREALISIRNQTYPNIEVTVVEDGPATLQNMLESEFRDLNLKYFPLGQNHGRGYTGTFGMEKSTGKYIRFLDEDDLLFSHSVETAVYFILKNQEKVKLVYDLAYEVPTEILSEDPLIYKEYDYKITYNDDFSQKKLFHHNFIPIQCVLFSRELFESCGGFDENLEVLEDWDLWIRYSMMTDFMKIPIVTSLYRVPADKELRKRRQQVFERYYTVVRKKYAYPN